MSQSLETDRAPKCKVESRYSNGILCFVLYIFILFYSQFQIKRAFLGMIMNIKQNKINLERAFLFYLFLNLERSGGYLSAFKIVLG